MSGIPQRARLQCGAKRILRLLKDKDLAARLFGAGLDTNLQKALFRAIAQYDRVLAALSEFDSLSTDNETSYQLDNYLYQLNPNPARVVSPQTAAVGMDLQDDILAVPSVGPDEEAEGQGLPLGALVLAIGGGTVMVIEDAIAAVERSRVAGNTECTIVYRAFEADVALVRIGDAELAPILREEAEFELELAQSQMARKEEELTAAYKALGF